jgi:hypothetical protein
MGTMIFLLPPELSPDAHSDLERVWVAAGPEFMPWPTRVQVELNRLIVQRHVGESGYLVAPWNIDGAGRLMGTSGTLIERSLPYQLVLELARGKVHQLRSQAIHWQEEGLLLPADLEESIRTATRSLCHAVDAAANEQGSSAAQLALSLGYQAADQLVHAYMTQLLQLRRQQQAVLGTALACRLSEVPAEHAAGALAATFDRIALAFPWSTIEPNEGHYDWSRPDALLDWADKEGLAVSGGPLVDFSSAQLPDWLCLWERDLTHVGKFMSNYVAAALKRYRGRIRRWHLTSASNSASVLSLSEQELLWLTVKVARAARQIDPGLELIIGVAEPWCDYMARADREQSPFLFAETLVRELKLAALDVELIMGVTPRGSYCRDLLETARLLDAYADLEVPLQVTLGYPSSSSLDPKADPLLCVDAGNWHGGVQETTQAEWATAFVKLALCKPYVEVVNWVHLSDAEIHQFPHCGLVNAGGGSKPSLQAIQQLSQTLLRQSGDAVG